MVFFMQCPLNRKKDTLESDQRKEWSPCSFCFILLGYLFRLNTLMLRICFPATGIVSLQACLFASATG